MCDELLTGYSPFKQDDDDNYSPAKKEEMIKTRIASERPDMSDVNISADAKNLIERLLGKKPTVPHK